MAVTDLIGNAQNYTSPSSYQILDSIYSENCILLNNALELLFGKAYSTTSIPLPMIGFKYKPTGSIELLKFTYSVYPYLNKQMITSGAIQNETRFSIMLLDPINNDNPVVAAILKRQTLVTLLEKYVRMGGLFTILTLWGTLKNCVLESFSGVESGGMDGTAYICNFVKPLFDTSSASAQLSSTLKSLSSGGIGTV